MPSKREDRGHVGRAVIGHLRANTIACVALFVALGGGAYAVAIAPKNSVVSRSIKNGQVRSADVKNNGIRGADVKEAGLGQVPRAKLAGRAANADALGGTPAVDLQLPVTGSCADAKAISRVGDDGTVECSTPVLPLSTAQPRGGSVNVLQAPSGLRVRALCHALGTGDTEIRFINDGAETATLNWILSKGGATSSVQATGVAVASGGSRSFEYPGARLEGLFTYADPDAITTVDLHAFDGISSCEVRGTAEVAAKR